MTTPITKILFVCTGNICRSPSAEAVFRAMTQRAGLEKRFVVDSAGTHDYHVGEPPDPRAINAARRRGIDLKPLRGRQVCKRDFASFDLILAMDRTHLALLLDRCPPKQAHKIRLFLSFDPQTPTRHVPDPYFGEESDFVTMLHLIESGAQALLQSLTKTPNAS